MEDRLSKDQDNKFNAILDLLKGGSPTKTTTQQVKPSERTPADRWDPYHDNHSKGETPTKTTSQQLISHKDNQTTGDITTKTTSQQVTPQPTTN